MVRKPAADQRRAHFRRALRREPAQDGDQFESDPLMSLLALQLAVNAA